MLSVMELDDTSVNRQNEGCPHAACYQEHLIEGGKVGEVDRSAVGAFEREGDGGWFAAFFR